MLTINNLSKKLGKTQVIDDLNLSINEGEVFGLLGPNGAGKSTLIRIIMGILAADSGKITLFGDLKPGSKAVRQNIGYMPQQLSIYPGLSVWENILFYGRIYQLEKSELHERANDILNMVELYQRKDDLVSELSGGMIRRVMLATALIHKPRLLILDEPTAGVDPLLRIKFWDWFAQMVDAGTSIIVTTHNISEASRCGNVVFLRNGIKLEQGTPQQIMDKFETNDLEAAFVEATNIKSLPLNEGQQL
ncbi:MAG: ABC transporter ATP-binding protein [Gammaproteobacteria bacterium]|nr:ABC transporter ATP-binding protein [Gammaproteobacteria bacterium]